LNSIADGTDFAEQASGHSSAEEHRRVRVRWAYRGFGVGVLIGFVQAAILFAFMSWRVFPVLFVFGLIYWPLFAALAASLRAPVPQVRRFSWRRIQFGTRTLMLLVAYIAVLCALGVLTAPVGRNAAVYHGKEISSQSMADLFGGIARKAEAEGPIRLRNAEELRAGRIPDAIMQAQKDFLRSLDKTATPEYRKYRYELIAAGEERLGKLDGQNAVIMRGLTQYHQQLSAKYRAAARRPWIPVAPDPPMPPTQ
jgi:hypothetical protein